MQDIYRKRELHMPQTASISVRVDAETKRKATVLLADLNMNMSTAISSFLELMVANKGLPKRQEKIRRHPSFKERLKDFKGEYHGTEWDTGEPVGREIF